MLIQSIVLLFVKVEAGNGSQSSASQQLCQGANEQGRPHSAVTVTTKEMLSLAEMQEMKEVHNNYKKTLPGKRTKQS